jgi:hypothetical protein
LAEIQSLADDETLRALAHIRMGQETMLLLHWEFSENGPGTGVT